MTKSIFLIFCFFFLAYCQPSCRFAHQYSKEQLLANATARQSYYESIMYWEGKFAQDGVGLNMASGLTYDGHAINYTTGEIFGDPHLFSAASKECIHVAILAHIINENPLAQLLVSNDSSVARQQTIEVLENKITSYEKFNATYPGFGGFLPWVAVNDSGMIPNDGWENQVPSLDNGELIWSMIALVEVLQNQNLTDLATRYQNYLDLMAKYAAMVFYAGDGNVRTVTIINDTSISPTPENYGGNTGLLNDPYEGELFVVFLCLYGGLNQSDIDLIWQNKVAQVVSVEYTTPLGPITVERGWEYSSHEKWKFLLLPYLDAQIMKRVFTNGEKARTWDSFINFIPGMFAAINDVSPNQTIPDYIGCGIPEIASNTDVRRDVITGYSIFPLFLVNNVTALLWYDTYLKGPKMQNPYGATEAININGTLISPLMTWDSKMTTVLGMLGGLVDINRKVISDKGVYETFMGWVNNLWTEKFPTLKGEELPFMVPNRAIPSSHLTDFTSCSLNWWEEHHPIAV